MSSAGALPVAARPASVSPPLRNPRRVSDGAHRLTWSTASTPLNVDYSPPRRPQACSHKIRRLWIVPDLTRSAGHRFCLQDSPQQIDPWYAFVLPAHVIRKASSILGFVGTSIDQFNHPGAERLGLGEGELRLALLIEEALAAPQGDRVDQQAVLIDKVVRQEGSDQAWGAVDDDILARLLLQL